MRRRLFWALVAVAALSGLLVLAGAVVSGRRAAIEATFREMLRSSQEAVSIIERIGDDADRPNATPQLLRLLEGESFNPLFNQIRRVTGGSEISFAALRAGDEFRTDEAIFSRVELERDRLDQGLSQFARTPSGELVVVTPTDIEVRDQVVTLLIAVARDAPILGLRDQVRNLWWVVLVVAGLAALIARVLARQFTSRLDPLADAARQVAEGDQGARVPTMEYEELEPVGAAFNDMAADLEAAGVREREFLLGVGHDLRTPLTTIAGYAEALESGHLPESEVRRIGSVVGNQSRQIARLMDDLTLLARLDQSEFSLRIESVELGGHLREVIAAFEGRAEESGIELDLDLDRQILVDTDPDRLAQIVSNLIDNALRHTPSSGSIRVSISADGPTLTIADTGPGIPARDLPHVFERYYSSQRSGGTGLGLSIVSGLADKLGLELGITSQVGQGTTVTLEFPVPEVGLEPTRPEDTAF